MGNADRDAMQDSREDLDWDRAALPYWLREWKLLPQEREIADLVQFARSGAERPPQAPQFWQSEQRSYALIAREMLLNRYPEAQQLRSMASLDNRRQNQLAELLGNMQRQRVDLLFQGSPQLLPPLVEGMHPLFALFAIAERPQTRDGLVRHVATYLDWYAGERRTPPLAIQFRALATLLTACSGVLLYSGVRYIIGLQQLAAAQASTESLMKYILLSIGLTMIFALRWIMGGRAFDRLRGSMLNHLALYLYLSELEEHPVKGSAPADRPQGGW